MRYENELEAVLQEIIQRWDVPGLAVGIVQGDEIAYAKGFGVQSLDTQAPVSLDSVFCIQSVSKCFVATAVMGMAERGKIDLDAPLVTSLPYFQMDDDRCAQITIRQALSHTSGMPDIDEFDYYQLVTHPEVDDGAAERFVRSLRDRKLIANPGERFSYSNIAYNVLGDLLAKVAGKSFESVMRENILIPVGMPNSTFLPGEVPTERLVMPHLRSPRMVVNPIYPYHRGDAPASFLHTTLVDLCHWAITCLERGSYHGQRILSRAGYDRMWTAVVSRSTQRPSLYEEMGLGWTLGHFKGRRTVSHGGGGFGGTAFLLILPDENCAGVVLCNQESDAHFRVVEAVADTLLGQQPQAGAVSWMIPISRALAQGGIEAAYERYAGLKAAGSEQVYCDESDLLDLALQLFSTNQVVLAIAVLGLNIYAHPGSVDSHLQQARLYQLKGDLEQAKERLAKALAIEPGHATAARLMKSLDGEALGRS